MNHPNRQLGGSVLLNKDEPNALGLLRGTEYGLLSVTEIPWSPETRSRLLVQLDNPYDIRGPVEDPQNPQVPLPFPLGIEVQWGMGATTMRATWPMHIRGLCVPVDGVAVQVRVVVLHDYTDVLNTQPWRVRATLLPGAPTLTYIPDTINASTLPEGGERLFIPPFMTHYAGYGDGNFATSQRSSRLTTALTGSGASNIAQPLPIHPWAVTIQRTATTTASGVVYQGLL